VPAEEIEAAVWAAVEKRLGDETLIAREYEARRHQHRTDSASASAASLRRQLATLERQQTQWLERMSNTDHGGRLWELVSAKVEGLETQRQAVLDRLREAEARASEERQAQADELSIRRR
jgi:hypothetical protein